TNDVQGWGRRDLDSRRLNGSYSRFLRGDWRNEWRRTGFRPQAKANERSGAELACGREIAIRLELFEGIGGLRVPNAVSFGLEISPGRQRFLNFPVPLRTRRCLMAARGGCNGPDR